MSGSELRTYLLTHNDREAAEAMDCSVNTIFKFRKALGIPSSRARVHQERLKAMIEARMQGKSYMKAIEDIDLTHSGQSTRLWREAREYCDRQREVGEVGTSSHGEDRLQRCAP